jgi:hypothetical protein
MRARLALCVGLCLALVACNSIRRLDSDSFAADAAGYDQFQRDDTACRLKGETELVSNPVLFDTTRYARNRAYNRVYGGCMTAKGHSPRPYYKNWLPPL